MSNRSWLVIKLFIAVCLFGLSRGVSFAEESPAGGQEFSGTMVMTGKAGNFQAKVFCAKNKERVEIASAAGVDQAISIIRMDKNAAWTLMPQQNMYMEMPLRPENMIAGAEKMPGEIKRELVGKEDVGGKSCNKYKISYVLDNQELAVFLWLTGDSNIPAKTAAIDGSWAMEYKDLTIAKQPDSLFEIPEGYQKFSPMERFVPKLPGDRGKAK